MNTNKSKSAFKEALKYIPGGVNSPVRAFKSVGSDPVFIQKGKGSHIWDIDGNEYIDYVCSWGPLILGHSRPAVVDAVLKALKRGSSFGAPTLLETELAKLVVEAVPSIEKIRMVNSGTEALMSAVRLARAYTKRDIVIKFEGCYHGHADGLLVKAGSGATTLGVPSSPGVPRGYAGCTVCAVYNDIGGLKKIFRKLRGRIACVVVEPVAGNMGVIPPLSGFLEGLRQICTENNSLLIFDEVITGFRLSMGGAQAVYNVMPDITCLGKIIGGGLPVGAYGGRAEIMDNMSPSGPVYQAGTLSGNPLAMAAGIAMLKNLKKDVYTRLESKASKLEDGLRSAAFDAGIDVSLKRAGSMMTMFFTGGDVRDYSSALKSDTKRYARYFRLMLEKGIYLAPSQFEAMFISAGHTDKDIENTIHAAKAVMRNL